jgi:creatinine amidohydrolase
MRFEDLNWMDVEKYLQQDDRLILVIGSCEQHGYLSLLTDIKIPLALADSASQLTGVLVGPSLNFGISPYFLDYPGTLSLSTHTMLLAIEDLIRSAYKGGFRRILIMNGHGGNAAVYQRLFEINNDLVDLKINWYDWWKSHSVEKVAQKHSLKPAHGNWLEAFPFTLVSNTPEKDKIPPKTPGTIMNSETAREVYGDGAFGGPYRVDENITNELLDAALKDVLVMLEFS